MDTLCILLDEGRHDLKHFNEAEKAYFLVKKMRSFKVLLPQMKKIKDLLGKAAQEIQSKVKENPNWNKAHKEIMNAVSAAENAEKRAEEAKKETPVKKKKQKSEKTKSETPGYLTNLEVVMVGDEEEGAPETTTPLSSTATTKETNVDRK